VGCKIWLQMFSRLKLKLAGSELDIEDRASSRTSSTSKPGHNFNGNDAEIVLGKSPWISVLPVGIFQFLLPPLGRNFLPSSSASSFSYSFIKLPIGLFKPSFTAQNPLPREKLAMTSRKECQPLNSTPPRTLFSSFFFPVNAHSLRKGLVFDR
jgi:hypothetical protein